MRSTFLVVDSAIVVGYSATNWGPLIVVDVEDGLKFACIDISSQQQKRKKALCIQTDLFLSFPITEPSFPINPLVWGFSDHFN